MVRAHWNGAVIADSDDTVVIEGNHYFPVDSVNEAYLLPSDTTTVCPWKGRASYYSLQVDGKVNRDAAWFYPNTTAAASSIRGRVAFWHGVKIEDDGGLTRRRSFLDRFRRDRIDAARGDAAVADEPASRDAAPVDLDDRSFFAALDGHVTVADFWAPWCGPCKLLHPLFDDIAAKHGTDVLQFVRINVDTSPGVAAAFNIMSIPTVIVFDQAGHEIDREIGLPDRRRLVHLARHAASMADATNREGVA